MILHIMIIEKFMPPFIDFIKRNFDASIHKFAFITSEKYLLGLSPEHNAEFLHTDTDFDLLKQYMQKSSKIVLHGLWRDKIDAILLEHKELLKKSYWIMWGADFYFPETQTKQRKKVIANIGFLVTANGGDVKYARTHYAATGSHVNCISYLSNVFYDFPITTTPSQDIHIQVGNSATKTNNHRKIFSQLADIKNNNVKIFCPLSYGDNNYALKVEQLGHERFGENFISLKQFLPFDEYQHFLSKIDYAIFDAQRQQSFSNILYLLGMGKKVFINKKSNLNQYFSELGITVYDTEHITLTPLDSNVRLENMRLIRQIFSEDGLKKSLTKWLEKS